MFLDTLRTISAKWTGSLAISVVLLAVLTGGLACRGQSSGESNATTRDGSELLQRARAIVLEIGPAVLNRNANEAGSGDPGTIPPVDAELLIEARELLEILLADPRQHAEEAWRLAGIVAVQENDPDLAAYAYHALTKGEPSPQREGRPDELLPALSDMPIATALGSIPGQHDAFLNLYDQVTEGDIASAAELAERYLSGSGVPRNKRAALHWLNIAADEGHAEAMFRLGDLLGKGPDRPSTESIRWYKKAAEKDHPEALYRLGMYEAKKNEFSSRAIKYFRRAAESGHAESMHQIGIHYGDGTGVSEDRAASTEWFQRAVDAGSVEALNALGTAYIGGKGVEKDVKKGFDLFMRGAELGNPNSMYNVGVSYRMGYGVERDDEKAISWLLKAANAGHESAKKALSKLGHPWEEPN
ncbi:MAG: sel1 repeat family protein [Planctomycetes bacterium]|nr:sel1 repeat family protein [Planctomycetota bacterium]